jgi:hypothetical protein
MVVISFITPRRAGGNTVCTLEHLGALATSLGVLVLSLGAQGTSPCAPVLRLSALTTSQGVPMTIPEVQTLSLAAPAIIVAQSGISSLGTLLVHM